jgi:hypothetical protein
MQLLGNDDMERPKLSTAFVMLRLSFCASSRWAIPNHTMSEYWKSTPKYWCKFCSLYVRDTSLEKKSHEATPKHQGNIQRSLRDLHKKSEREDREKQNGLVGAKEPPSVSVASSSRLPAAKPKSAAPSAPASVAERRRQIEQLAAMGVAVPEEYRRDMSIQGDWSTVSERVIYPRPVKSDDEDGHDGLAFGTRKRKLDEDEEQDAKLHPKAWGSRLKTYPGAKDKHEDDLDALLLGVTTKKKVKSEADPLLKEEGPTENAETLAAVPDIADAGNTEPEQKVEPKSEQDAPIVFKKRKSKR